jgi:site-specific DNA recombinase
MNWVILRRKSVLPGREGNAMAAAAAGGGLAGWVERSAARRAGGLMAGGMVPGRLRFVFYGRVSTEDWQDPVTSRARQQAQAEALVRGHGVIVAEFFDAGESRTVAWARRPQSSALVAQLADPGRGWDAVVIGEYERAFYGSQYAAMAPLLEHYGVRLWMPEAGGRVDYASEHDEKAMTVLGLSSKREITRTSIRVRTAMAAQTREQGAISAAARRTGTGSRMRDRTRIRLTPRGDVARIGSSPTRRPLR